jgi:lipid-A-disaccharide synthase
MKLLVSAVEPSANLHLKEILSFRQNIELMGIFDESLGTPLYGSSEFAVMGIVDALKKYFKAKEAIKEMAFLAGNADKVLLIDAPSFNIPLAKEIKKRYPNKEIIYYILPKVWIWKKYRAKLIEKFVDKSISILPFEKEYYPSALYFGNPLYNQIEDFRDEVLTNSTISYLAGSRKSEITMLMSIFKEVAKHHHDKNNILVIPPYLSDKQIEEYYGDISMFGISRDTHKALHSASFAYVCSGTATLEASLIGVPFVLVYRAKRFDYWLINLLAGGVEFVGLANIIYKYEGLGLYHKELLQEKCNTIALIDEYNHHDSSDFLNKSKRLREILKGNTSQEIANVL